MEIFSEPSHKWNWLLDHMVEFVSCGQLLIFVTKKGDSEEVATNLKTHGYDLLLLHGDMDQSFRSKSIAEFKKGD